MLQAMALCPTPPLSPTAGAHSRHTQQRSVQALQEHSRRCMGGGVMVLTHEEDGQAEADQQGQARDGVRIAAQVLSLSGG